MIWRVAGAVVAACIAAALLLTLFPAKLPTAQPISWRSFPARTAIILGDGLYLYDSPAMLPCRLLPVKGNA